MSPQSKSNNYDYRAEAQLLVEKLAVLKTKQAKIDLINETIADIVGELFDAKANGGCDW